MDIVVCITTPSTNKASEELTALIISPETALQRKRGAPW